MGITVTGVVHFLLLRPLLDLDGADQVVGGLTGWYPYPFLDHREEQGVLGVVVLVAAITVFFLLLFALARLVDQRARPAPEAWDPYRGSSARA